RAAPLLSLPPGILILGLLLATPSCLGYNEDLAKCFQDPDCESFLSTAQEGLPVSPLPKRVAVVGASVSGLAAAKTLQDTGHKVTVLEASNHIGGGVVTFRNKEEEDWYCELGPMRILKSHRKAGPTCVRKLGLKLNKFIQYNGNTWFLIKGRDYRTWEVKANPELLGYSMNLTEKGKSAMSLFHQSIDKVPPASPQLGSGRKRVWPKEGKLNQAAVCMTGDVMNEGAGYRKSLRESLWAAFISGSEDFSEITGGFDQLPNALGASLKPGTIRLRSGVEVVARDGRGAGATRLIAFQPPLATKVVLACGERFWEHDGIWGGESIAHPPSRYILYPSHSFPSGKGVLLASDTRDDDSLFCTALEHDQVVDIVLGDLAAVHQIPREELQRTCPSSVVKQRSRDPLTIGAFAEFTPYQPVDHTQQLSQPEGRIHFAGEHACLPLSWRDTAIKSGLRAARNIQATVDEEARNRRPSPTSRRVSPQRAIPEGVWQGQAGRWEEEAEAQERGHR
uniref:Amine oxidase domain-containing protein n=1 Tax=Prolemur simus TaxID=1328070 RepID=A0A8C9AF33_PROSS